MDTLGHAIISGGPSEWKVWAMRCLQGCVDDAHGFFFELRTHRKMKNSTEISRALHSACSSDNILCN